MLGSEFFTLGHILMQARTSTSLNPAKKTQVTSTGSFGKRMISPSPETSSDEDFSDEEVQIVKL